ncbi:hypothetical protein BRC61_00540 [Halobacteriales archaeon QH_10_65_19]|jgi:hypothetical protein|nr:MAG: hypothetical protein BRC61_00540 [Halobacteriales archaeon QH_10_65_19]
MGRGQASITAVEAGLGVLLLFTVTLGFAFGVPGDEPAKTRAQLDTYAADAATLLANEPPRHANQTRLAEVAASADAFERERDALERRVDRILPDNLLFRVRTPHGSVGYPPPDGVETGTATVLTTEGDVTLSVWYA